MITLSWWIYIVGLLLITVSPLTTLAMVTTAGFGLWSARP